MITSKSHLSSAKLNDSIKNKSISKLICKWLNVCMRQESHQLPFLHCTLALSFIFCSMKWNLVAKSIKLRYHFQTINWLQIIRFDLVLLTDFGNNVEIISWIFYSVKTQFVRKFIILLKWFWYCSTFGVETSEIHSKWQVRVRFQEERMSTDVNFHTIEVYLHGNAGEIYIEMKWIYIGAVYSSQ